MDRLEEDEGWLPDAVLGATPLMHALWGDAPPECELNSIKRIVRGPARGAS